ncbi:MAG: carboxymuconolactone decarboxylase family protein [Bryobacteraceae bacterium]
MPRINPIQNNEAAAKAKDLLNAVQAKIGMTPNLMKTLAHSPAALEGYLNFSGALATGALDGQLREQIAIAVAQANSCEYCLSAHTTIGKMTGLNPEALTLSREAHSADAKRDAGLQFAQKLVIQRGVATDNDLAIVRQAGYNDAEITEIVAHVGLNVFTNYFNHVAQTDVDFPRVAVTLSQTA